MAASANGRGAVVVTGASTGIGNAAAQKLDALGFEVFAGVRNDEDAERVSSEGSDRLQPLTIDVTDEGSVRAAAERVRERLGDRKLVGLVNNAGVAVTAPLEFIPIEKLRHQLEVNVVGQVAVTQAFLPMLRKSRGRIVNISSVGGRVALPFVGPYAASKHALEGLSDSLRREIRNTGVQVSLIEPGAVATPIWDKGRRAADELMEQMPAEAGLVYGKGLDAIREAAAEQAAKGIPPEQVADCVAHAMTADKPRTRYPVGKGVRARITLAFLLPDRVFDRMIARVLGF